LYNGEGNIWFPAIPENKDKVSQSLKDDVKQTKSETPLYDAIDHALDLIQKSDEDSYKLIFCLTDGLDTDSKTTSLAKLEERLKLSKISVITVGYGKDSEDNQDNKNETLDALNGPVLAKIASSSGAGKVGEGSFINVSPEKLSDILKNLATDLNNIYEIQWKAGFPDANQDVRVTIKVEYPSSTGQTVEAEERKTYRIKDK
jgi:hypothetical protein